MRRAVAERSAGPERTRQAMFENRDEVRVPIVEEEVQIGKRKVETGRVRVHTVVDEERLNLTELLERDVVDIERVPVGREVATAPLPFEEGDVLVIPIIEERLIFEKRLVVVEEVRIRRRQVSAPANIPVTRRVMHAEIERDAPPPSSPAASAAMRDGPRSAQGGFMNEQGQAPRGSDFRNQAARAPDFRDQGGAAAPSRGGPRAAPAAAAAPRDWTMVLVAVVVILLLLALAAQL